MEKVTMDNYTFELEVTNVGHIINKGNYVFGTIKEGSIKQNQKVKFEKTGKTFVIRYMYVDSEKKKEVFKGEKPTIFLEAESHEEFSDGNVLYSP